MSKQRATDTGDEPRRIVHLSDLHFGTTRESLVQALVDRLTQLRADLIVVSGDLTQRATPGQFALARSFLDALQSPFVIVPGNHDIAPLYRPWERLLRPFDRYLGALRRPLDDHYQDAQIGVFGVNSVAPLRIKDGALSERRLKRMLQRVHQCPSPFRAVVAHHCPDAVRTVLGSSRSFIHALGRARVDAYLCGHGHASINTVHTTRTSSGAITFLHFAAGTTTSHRVREEPNAFSVLDVRRHHVAATVHHFDGARFESVRRWQFSRHGRHWQPADESAAQFVVSDVAE